MNSETVEALHAVTSAMKDAQQHRTEWMNMFDDHASAGDGTVGLLVSRVEAEQIFAQRIAAHEARLKELGWSRTVRVESQPQGDTK